MRVPNLHQFEPVRIEWQDAVGVEEGWNKLRKKDMLVRGCVTVGQVLAQNEDSVTVCLTWDPVTKHHQGAMTIPNVAISKLERYDR